MVGVPVVGRQPVVLVDLPQLGGVEAAAGVHPQGRAAGEGEGASPGEHLMKLAPGERRKQTAEDTCRRVRCCVGEQGTKEG